MFVLLILLVVIFAAGAIFALARGLLAFSRIGESLRQGDEDPYLERGKWQNKMMTQRVLFQAMAILAVTAIGLLFSAK